MSETNIWGRTPMCTLKKEIDSIKNCSSSITTEGKYAQISWTFLPPVLLNELDSH